MNREYCRQLFDLCEAVAGYAIEDWKRLSETDDSLTLSEVLGMRFAIQMASLQEVGFDLSNLRESDGDAEQRYERAASLIEDAVTNEGSGECSIELIREIVRYEPSHA